MSPSIRCLQKELNLITASMLHYPEREGFRLALAILTSYALSRLSQCLLVIPCETGEFPSSSADVNSVWKQGK